MSWLSVAWSAVTAFFSGTTTKLVLIAVGVSIVALVGYGCSMFWADYNSAKADVILYKEKLAGAELSLKMTVADSAEKVMQLADQERRHRQDLVDQQKRYKQKIEILQTVNNDITTIKNIVRPIDEKNCPVHPAIIASFDILRERSATATGDDH